MKYWSRGLWALYLLIAIVWPSSAVGIPPESCAPLRWWDPWLLGGMVISMQFIGVMAYKEWRDDK